MNRLYYDPAKPSAFSTLEKLKHAAAATGKKKKTTVTAVRDWLLQQDAYTLHKPVRKRFHRNPYTVTNINDVWELDLADMHSLSKHNDNYKYLLNVIDVFSKYAYSVPLRSKTGSAITSAFESILEKDHHRRRPVWVRTDKGKEFVNSTFQHLLKREGIQFQVCRNPDVKCAVIERLNRTLKTRMYRYFTYKNTYRYIDVLDKFVRAYNNTIHTTTGMAPSKVRDTDVLAIWNRMRDRALKRARSRHVVFQVGQHVRISKEKMKFAKGYEQNYSTEVFKISKVVPRQPRPVYELEDLQGTQIEGQFYTEELTPVIITKKTQYKIDKILGTRVQNGIREYRVRWKGYSSAFDSWIPAKSVKQIR